jgi:transposase, IS5 family
MIGKSTRQGHLLDGWLAREGAAGRTGRFLEKLEATVDFGPIQEELEKLYPAKLGRPSHPPLVLFKMLLLEHCYNLSDPEVEAQVSDRLSFRRFVGLSLEASVPDETALVRFRARLVAGGVEQRLLEHVNAQLEARGLILKKAVIVDATLVEAATQRPTKEAYHSGQVVDPEASYTRKGGEAHYGFKAHVAVDGRHNLIRRVVLGTAKQHDNQRWAEVVPTDARCVYADKGYAGAPRQAWLREHGIAGRIMVPKVPLKGLTPRQHQLNRRWSRVRGRIERVFAHWKRCLGYQRVRYRGVARNQLELHLKAIAYNLKRFTNLCPA